MQTIADIILACGALGVAFYCFVLSRRLTRFNNLEHGVGGAVAVLSAQVDDLNRALENARRAAETSGNSLSELTERAEAVSRRLELHVAAMHDIAEPAPAPAPSPAPASAPQAAPDAAGQAPYGIEPATRAYPAPPRTTDTAAAPASRTSVPAPQAPSIRAARPVRSFFATETAGAQR